MNCRPSGSSVHGVFQARVLEWVAISFSRRSSQPRDRMWVSHIAGQMLYHLSHQGSLIMVEIRWGTHVYLWQIHFDIWQNKYNIVKLNEIKFKKKLKITHIFSSAMWHLPREIVDIVIERLNEVKRLKTHRGWLKRRKYLKGKLISKWGINIKSTKKKEFLKKTLYLEIKCSLLKHGCIY